MTAINVGQISYFEGYCPDGWGDYTEAQDRFIVGVSGKYSLKSKGGEEFHTLTINEMPAHNHNDGVYNVLLKYDGYSTLDSSDNR